MQSTHRRLALPMLRSGCASASLRKLSLRAAAPSSLHHSHCYRHRSSSSISGAFHPTVRTDVRWLATAHGESASSPTASAAPSALSASDFAAITPRMLLRQALQQYTELDGTHLGAHLHRGENHVLISRDRFLRFCAQAHVEDPDAALAELDAAGVVVALDGGRLVHLRPVLYLETLDLLSASPSGESGEEGTAGGGAVKGSSSRTSVPVGAFMLEESERRIADLATEERAMAQQLQPAIARAAKWRRTVWGGALLFAGTQLAVISRLTYFDLDWDIMEPVSYCVTIGTALIFYVYYLLYNEEHTYAGFDQRFLPKKVRQYAPKDFDWPAYERVCARLVEEEAMRERIRRWAERF